MKNLRTFEQISKSIRHNCALQRTAIKKPKKINFFLFIFLFAYHTSLYSQQWQFLGLSSESTTAIAVDWAKPNIIYAGSSSDFSAESVGGVFKSINGGTSWDTLIRGVTVRDLDIHPIDSKIIFATLGLNVLTQAGIIKSTNGGISWVKADSGLRITWEEGPSTLVIDPKRPDTMYTGTSGFFGGRFYKSTNAGKSWFVLGDTTALRDGVTAIAINPINTNVIFAGTAFSGNLLKSTDGGVSWVLTGLQTGITNTINFNQNSSIIYVGGAPTKQFSVSFFKSTDQGITWQNIKAGLPDTFAVYAMQTSYYNNVEKFFISGGYNFRGMWMSSDGERWKYFSNVKANFITIKNEMLYVSAKGIYVTNITTSIDDTFFVPSSIYLFQNYPNPFNSSTKIVYEIVKEENISIEVFDILGKKIKILLKERKSPGKYITSWDGTDDERRTVSSGLYICILKTKYKTLTIKMLYMK